MKKFTITIKPIYHAPEAHHINNSSTTYNAFNSNIILKLEITIIIL